MLFVRHLFQLLFTVLQNLFPAKKKRCKVLLILKKTLILQTLLVTNNINCCRRLLARLFIIMKI